MRERRVRLASGLLIAVFVLLHLLSHAGGIVSYEWMEAGRRLQALLWQHWPGTVLLYGALLTHLALGLRSLYRRRTLRMPVWEAAQLGFGLAIPLLLAGHVVGTRLGQSLLGFQVDYPFVVTLLWNGAWHPTKQSIALVVVWVHLCIGLHFWLRLHAWYPRALPVLYALAVAVPLLSLTGFVRAGVESLAWRDDPARMAEVFAGFDAAPLERQALLKDLVAGAPWLMAGLYLAVLAARQVRVMAGRRRGQFTLRHASGRSVQGRMGQTVLEAIRAARIPHASVCGGRARCTTCRVRVGQGLQALPPPSRGESAALTRIGAPPNVRLACQVRPRADLDVTPVLPPDAGVRHPGGVQGREQRVAAMFVDLRGSTELGERRLPYDVVFVLNRFFEEMSAALAETGGHYAQFAGDGLLALYGLTGGYARGCRDALAGTVAMSRRLALLNERLSGELEEPLRIGIGLHGGEAIVGTMGPPASPNFSAVGDNINVAARLEQHSKQLGCTLVVSAVVAERAGVDLSAFPMHSLPVRGREQLVRVHAVEDPTLLEALLTTPQAA